MICILSVFCSGHQTAQIDLEERHLNEKNQLAHELLKESFILKRQLLMTRNAKVCGLTWDVFYLLLYIVTLRGGSASGYLQTLMVWNGELLICEYSELTRVVWLLLLSLLVSA